MLGVRPEAGVAQIISSQSRADLGAPCTSWDAKSVSMTMAWLATSDGVKGVACGWPPTGREVRGKRGGTSPAWKHAGEGSGLGYVEACHEQGKQT